MIILSTDESLPRVEGTFETNPSMPSEQLRDPLDDFIAESADPSATRGAGEHDAALMEFETENDINSATAPALVPPAMDVAAAAGIGHERVFDWSRLKSLTLLALVTVAALAAAGSPRALTFVRIAGPLPPIRVEGGLGTTGTVAPGASSPRIEPIPPSPRVEPIPPAMHSTIAAETISERRVLPVIDHAPIALSAAARSSSFITSPPALAARAPITVLPSRPPEAIAAAVQPPVPLTATNAGVSEAARIGATAAVESILSRYVSAFTALDARQVQSIWPTVDARALDRAFDGLQKQEFDLGTCDIAVTGARATASCTGLAHYVPKVGKKNVRMQPRIWRFVLLRMDEGAWAIQSVHTQ